ncbi:MAG: AmfC protein [Frankiales bacterium]|nr:AmfC protein [Frankiales bacterium]
MSEEVLPGGHRRVDRVLADDYLDGLRDVPLPDLRAMRIEAEQEETDVSYLRRMVQGRMDIVEGELARRRGEGSGSLVEDLPRILADAPSGGPRGLGRHNVSEPSRADQHRRRLEALIADLQLSDVPTRTDGELDAALTMLREEELLISERRREIQRVVDACHAEVARRYRDGEADVSDALPTTDSLDS